MGKEAANRTRENARCDAAIKRLLADKTILAWILRSCTVEFRDMEAEEIARTCISREPQIAETAVMPDETNEPLRIQGTGVEDTTITEGTVTFDIRFEASAPGRAEQVSLIINLEAQNDFYPGYPLVKRGIYYGSRLISSQYGTVFTKSHYEKVRKVYSIWICTNPPKGRRNTVTEYSMTEKAREGNAGEPVENYDLLTVVMVCLGGTEQESGTGILKLLGALLSSRMKAEEKRKVLEQEFHVKMTGQLEREVSEVCNLSRGFWEEGREEGREEGIEATLAASIESLMMTLKLTAEQAMDALRIPEKEQAKYRAMLKG